MPKLYVKRLFGEGVRQPTLLAQYFDVSAVAMSYRLDQIGLTMQRHRCGLTRTTRSHAICKEPAS